MKERPARVCALAREGHTAAEIAKMVGIHPDRVRRTLARYEVPFTKGKQPRDPALVSLNDGLPLKSPAGKYSAFNFQKRAAARRGIEWDMTFAEWIKVWTDSGHFAERGVGPDKYCMARYGDVGPYRVDNVRIILFSDNVREARQLDWERRRQAKRLQATQSGVPGADPVVSTPPTAVAGASLVVGGNAGDEDFSRMDSHALSFGRASLSTPLN